MEPRSTRSLASAARVADALVAPTGVAGVVAGALLLRDEQIAFAIIAWVLTFVAGAGLRLAAAVARGVSEVLTRVEHLEGQVGTLLRTDSAARWRDWH